MKYAERITKIEPSLTRQLFNMAQNYNDVINLTLGDPDLLPPKNVRKQACKSIMDGKTRYSANAGLLEARKVIVKNFNKEYSLNAKIENTILTVGGMEGLFLAFSCLINPGDEVIIPAPYYVNYYQMVQLNGGTPVLVDTEECNNFNVTAKDIEAKITDKTKVIILNSPCNPTGEILDKETIVQIASIAKKYDLFVISDEVYKTLVYDGVKCFSILEVPEMQERTLLIDSMSKRFSMTGYRCGYAIGPNELIANMIKLQENVVACTPLPSQYAAIEAYSKKTDIRYIQKEFQKRRDIMADGINSIDNLSCHKPSATFYLFVNISRTGLKSLDFAFKLLEKEHVAVVPGVSYGNFDNYVRIAFTLKEENLKEAVTRIKRFVEEL